MPGIQQRKLMALHAPTLRSNIRSRTARILGYQPGVLLSTYRTTRMESSMGTSCRRMVGASVARPCAALPYLHTFVEMCPQHICSATWDQLLSLSHWMSIQRMDALLNSITKVSRLSLIIECSSAIPFTVQSSRIDGRTSTNSNTQLSSQAIIKRYYLALSPPDSHGAC